MIYTLTGFTKRSIYSYYHAYFTFSDGRYLEMRRERTDKMKLNFIDWKNSHFILIIVLISMTCHHRFILCLSIYIYIYIFSNWSLQGLNIDLPSDVAKNENWRRFSSKSWFWNINFEISLILAYSQKFFHDQS